MRTSSALIVVMTLEYHVSRTESFGTVRDLAIAAGPELTVGTVGIPLGACGPGMGRLPCQTELASVSPSDVAQLASGSQPELDRSRQAAAAPTDGQRILTTEFPLDAIGPTMADGCRRCGSAWSAHQCGTTGFRSGHRKPVEFRCTGPSPRPLISSDVRRSPVRFRWTIAFGERQPQSASEGCGHLLGWLRSVFPVRAGRSSRWTCRRALRPLHGAGRWCGAGARGTARRPRAAAPGGVCAGSLRVLADPQSSSPMAWRYVHAYHGRTVARLHGCTVARRYPRPGNPPITVARRPAPNAPQPRIADQWISGSLRSEE